MPDDSEAAIPVCTKHLLMHLGDCRSLPRPFVPHCSTCSFHKGGRGGEWTPGGFHVEASRGAPLVWNSNWFPAADASQPFHTHSRETSPHTYFLPRREGQKKNLPGRFLFQIYLKSDGINSRRIDWWILMLKMDHVWEPRGMKLTGDSCQIIINKQDKQ